MSKNKDQNRLKEFNGIAIGCGSTAVQTLKELFEDEQETRLKGEPYYRRNHKNRRW